MEFKIDRNIFLKALQKVQNIVEKRNTMPILANVLIEADNESISLTATDLEVGIKGTYSAFVDVPGKITVSAKKLYEIVKESPNDEISIKTKENDWIDIKCGKSRFSIVGFSAEEFPFFPKVNSLNYYSIDSQSFHKMIESTSFAMCNDETKYNLNGIYFRVMENSNSKKVLRMVSTDAHRLSLADQFVSDDFAPELNEGVIVPKKGIFEIKKMTEDISGDVLIGFLDNSIVLKKDETDIVIRLVEGTFPDYTRVIPYSNNNILVIEREELLQSLRRTMIMSNEKFKGIRFDINKNNIVITSNNPDLGEGIEEIDTLYNDDEVSARYNPKYIIDAISAIESNLVEIRIKNENTPIMIKQKDNDNMFSVVMPMRI